MSDERALMPIDEKMVVFYDDQITAVIVNDEGGQTVYVPIRPICDYLGIDWSAQRRRITGDPVLADVVRSVVVTATEAGGRREMTCLPLDFLNGWLFGVSARRIQDETIQNRVIRYQRECYRVLARAFQQTAETAVPPASTLYQVREMGRAIMQMAEEQIEFERRLTSTEGRLNQAAIVVGDIGKRLAVVEEKLTPKKAITESQAMQISQAVKAVAFAMGGRKENFQGVYGELYRHYEITSYKLLPANRFEDCMAWLTEWHMRLTGLDKLPF